VQTVAVENVDRKDKLLGVIGALRTFTNEDYTPNLDKQAFHLNWVIENGITTGNGCIMVAAGGSEGYFMSDEEWEAQVKTAAEVADGRVPVIAGIFELSAREALVKAEFAAKVGCDFVQVAPPHYMLPSNAEVIEHFRWINDNVDIGIFAYNTPWAQPQPGYDFQEPVFEKFVKWSSFDQGFYLTMSRLFTDKLNFICNQMNRVLSLPAKLGFKGFINSNGLVAPRFVLHQWDLFKNGKFNELDDFLLKTEVDPFLRLSQPEDIVWRSMGEGPYVRLGMEALGLKMGPSFPAQQPLSADSERQRREGFEKSGIFEWVDWKEELWEKHRDGK
jgi:4-hydroxy-tetrahydrodipicolinate synthase